MNEKRPLNALMDLHGRKARGQPEAFVDCYVERTPLKRTLREENLKGAVAYLASDVSSYLIGQTMMVDGGLVVW